MNRALWYKAIVEARLLLLGLSGLMFTFHWIRIWVNSQFPIGNLRAILALLPPIAESLFPLTFDQMVSPVGRVAIAYDDPTPVFLCAIWAIGRGSDVISGEIGRGGMEMLLAQPISRLSLLISQSVTTVVGAALLCLSAWLGTWVGLSVITLEEPVDAQAIIPAALNLFCFTFCLCGITTAAGSFDSYRWRTIGIGGGFLFSEILIKVISRARKDLIWLDYLTITSAYEPAKLALSSERSWSFWFFDKGHWVLGGLGYNGVLIGIGLLAYVLAAVVFCRRDLPAPV